LAVMIDIRFARSADLCQWRNEGPLSAFCDREPTFVEVGNVRIPGIAPAENSRFELSGMA
jgi:hypothetical protein